MSSKLLLVILLATIALFFILIFILDANQFVEAAAGFLKQGIQEKIAP
jgi:hypothetical protein